ncbi:MAG TPA: nuclear transport factor 2 family protein [Dyella sp.]|uniref:nuclear transport factor 2 family protein n=1 Tax=Dyella sp. TaxID=1869338 RepID=UPI002C416D5A|nr:nuclear transport factor 2 family protein [Dyella sp.]HUB89290.1 nuclear transport factor 2 family protein [Dyella sp.]
MTIFTLSRAVAMTAAIAFACLLLTPRITPVHAQDTTPAADETLPTEAGVMAVDNHWTLAEEMGDTAWLEQMLLPDYRSVGNDGKAHPKAAIIAGAAKRKGTSLAQAKAEWAAYQRQHPIGSTVVVRGNTAIVTFYDPASGPQNGVRSSDVFIYVDGHWHALYSQHTAVRT